MSNVFTRIPKIKEQATEVIVIFPNVRLNPPIPEIKIVDTT